MMLGLHLLQQMELKVGYSVKRRDASTRTTRFPQMCEGASSTFVTIYVLRIVNCFAVSQAPSKVLHYSRVLVLRLQSQLNHSLSRLVGATPADS